MTWLKPLGTYGQIEENSKKNTTNGEKGRVGKSVLSTDVEITWKFDIICVYLLSAL